MRKPAYPKQLRAGSVVVKIYRVRHKTTKSGFDFVVGWRDADGKPRRKHYADEDTAHRAGSILAADLSAGRREAEGFGADERDELSAIRAACGDYPALSAIREWRAAYDLTRGRVLDAAKAWAKSLQTDFKPVTVAEAVEAFIAAKEAAGSPARSVYGSKLGKLAAHFGARELHSITAAEWTAYFGGFANGVTRNDHRKRAVTLCRWARGVGGYLPREKPLEVEYTEHARESPVEIGILTPDVFGRVLAWLRENRPDMLGAVALAGFCGIRNDELQGKREDRGKRQLWEDVLLDQKIARVTVAKRNTPSWRHVPLCDAAVAWLSLCAERTGPVCPATEMERIRVVLRDAGGFVLPDNCFRHSYISHAVAATGNKAQVATDAGTSVAKIDKHYRVPLTKEVGEAWFSVLPG